MTDNTTAPRNTNNANCDESILHNSMNYLEQYRKEQASKLAMRLNIFKQAAISKYGSIDKIKDEGGSPIESQVDIDIIENLINLQTFVTIPVYADTINGKVVTQCYTLGLWYYWGLPELVISFETPINGNIEFINLITNVIHDELFFMFKNKIIKANKSTSNDIYRIDYKPDTINLILSKFDIEFKLKRVHKDDYMSIRAMYMMWFYMYYMDALKNKKNKPKLYPMYKITMNEANYRDVCKKVVDVLVAKTMSANSTNNNDSECISTYSDSIESEESDTLPIKCVVENGIETVLNNDVEDCDDNECDSLNVQTQAAPGPVGITERPAIKKKYW